MSLREIAFATLLLGGGLLAGWIYGEFGWALFCALSIWVVAQYREYRKFRRWTKRPLQRPSNAPDSWFMPVYRTYRAVKRQRERTQSMVRRLRQVLNLAEHIPDGVIILGEGGDIEGFNTSARALLHLDDDDIGLSFASIVREPTLIEYIKNTENREPLEFASPYESAQTLEARIIDDAAGSSIVLIRDNTALNRLLTVRQEFVANVSHELRTPLAVVSGYMETLSDPDEDPELKLALVERIQGPVERIQSLVNDLLLLTRLESPEESRQSAPVSLARVLEQSLTNALHGEDRDRVELDIQSRALIEGNESELTSVCTNLLSNAIRYSPDGGPIRAMVREVDGELELSVTDSGVGIAPEHLHRLTERFYRVDLADARTRGGTGLGLAIVKHVLRRHESMLEVDSQLGAGSRFSARFKRLGDASPQGPDATREVTSPTDRASA